MIPTASSFRTLTFATIGEDLAEEIPLPRLVEQDLDLNFHVKAITYAAKGRVTKDSFSLGSPITTPPGQPAQPPQPAQVRYSAVWKQSTENEIQVYGWTYDDYRKKYDELWPQGWRVGRLEPFVL